MYDITYTDGYIYMYIYIYLNLIHGLLVVDVGG